MIKKTKYNITINVDIMDKVRILKSGFKCSDRLNILRLDYINCVDTSLDLNHIIGDDYSYELQSLVYFDKPKTVINSLNLFSINCVRGFLGGGRDIIYD